MKDLYRRLERIYRRHQTGVKIQNWFGLFFVSGEPLTDDIFISIVKPVVFNCAFAQATNQFIAF